MVDSRLTRRSVKQSQRQLYTSIIIIIVLIAVLLNFGPYLIARAGGFIDTITGKNNQNTIIVTDDDLKPPTLDSLPKATKTDVIKVSGTSFYTDGLIVLVLNGEEIDEEMLENSQEFEFEYVKLKEGENFLKARIEQGDKQSEYSEEETITFSKGEPKLEISFPTDQQSFSKADKTILVKGTTDSENTVNINGIIAIVDTSGNFQAQVNLNNGENKLKITAQNPASVETSKELTVFYSE